MRIKVPATSANLAVGFDCLGVALSIYNEFEIYPSSSYEVIGFEEKYKEDNLVLKAYKRLLETNGLNVANFPVTIQLLQNDIPLSRGLGSSASCIVAGVIASNKISGLNLTLKELLPVMIDIEGHPDNILPAVYGGLVSGFIDDSIYSKSVEVHNDYKFYVCISDHIASTEALRQALPSSIAMDDAVFNLSRAIHVESAFQSGDLKYLRAVLKDKLHQRYRAEFIPYFESVKNVVEHNGDILVISGSGSTLLIISDKNISYSVDGIDIQKVEISKGVSICE